ncbi:spermidine synthase [Paeniglutamicibacter sp. NPDC012692]|uniref:spermidine synthase n=1 Tax=Paeniglutamicibacter sp. NPDC012692 TaxID=3364388 RepID=UPI00367739FC
MAKGRGKNTKNTTKNTAEQPAGNEAADTGPIEGNYPIDTGTATLERDHYSPEGWILKVNGVPSSHVDLAAPERLDFEYMRWIAALIRSRFAPAAFDGNESKLRALHLGGGACSMARWAAATYPNARQVVVELDGKLAELVRAWFDLPRSPLLRLRVGEAGEVLRSLTDATRDLVIRDVFAGDQTPKDLTTLEFTAHAARVLDTDGLYIVNCGDTPALDNAKREAATIGSVFKYVAIIADPPMLKGRRYGNVIIAGSNAPIPTGPDFTRELLGGGVPAQHWEDATVRAFARHATAI